MKTLIAFLFCVGTSFALETPPTKPSFAKKAVTPAPALSVPADTRSFTNDPKGGGITATGVEEELRTYTTVTVQFPTEMVFSDKIDTAAEESPVVISPELSTVFTWHTPTEGDFMVEGPLIPGQTYRFRLREGLKDLAENAVSTSDWGVEMTTPALRVESNYDQRDHLNSRPQVPLEFNYPMRLSDVAQGVWFQNRLTRERFPAEVLLNYAEGDLLTSKTPEAAATEAGDITEFRVRPLSPLPIGQRYDLVVDQVCDAFSGRTLPYPKVFPLGDTRPLSVEYVVARNAPLSKPQVEVKFRQLLNSEPLPNDALTFTPPVSNVRLRKEGAVIFAEGDFDVSQRYEVLLNQKITGVSGYPLAAAEKWGATFRPKDGTVVFPARELRERSALGLAFTFFQVNTSELEWRLAPIPLETLPVVLQRQREFDAFVTDASDNPVWTEEGLLRRKNSEPLIPALGLKAVASGSFPAASGEKELLREISWKSPETSLHGPMLLEVTGKDAKGRIIGNRAVIYFGDVTITRKKTNQESILRVAKLGDAEPVAGALVVALDKELKEIAKTATDEKGIATFQDSAIPQCAYFLARTPHGDTLQPLALSDQFAGGSLSARPPPVQLRSFILTDRPLYRPGQSVQFKGMAREEKSGVLAVPPAQTVKWTVEREYGSEVFANGESKLDADGSWNGSWLPPDESQLGNFIIKAKLGGRLLPGAARFQIEEFRNPPFSVVCTPAEPQVPAESTIKVESQYFHGAANAGAQVKWTATWFSDSEDGYYMADDSGMTRVDFASEKPLHPSFYEEVYGETALDGNGMATLRCPAPFKDPGNRAHSHVSWKVDIIGPDGQTIIGGTAQDVAMAAVLLGLKHDEVQKGTLTFHWDALTPFAGKPEAVSASLFFVSTKSVKERLAPNVYRYRNFDQFQLVEKRDKVSEETLTFKPAQPGRYVLVLSPLPGQPGFPVSEEIYLAGPGESEVPVESDTAVTLLSIKGAEKEDAHPWMVGETAALDVLSPTGGIAWVSVETDKIHDTFTVPIKGNTSRLEIPIKTEYEPNAFVSVYLLRPGHTDQLAGEMYGTVNLAVRASDRELDVKVRTGREEYQPREKISGEVTVMAAGQPVTGADVLVYAVDDSILTLGNWQLPEMLSSFLPVRDLGVLTFSALTAYVDKVAPSWLTMKGFVVGGGGDDEFGNVTFTRKDFKPLILWQPNVKTDARGVAQFSCDAPDNLTRFRVVAVAQTRKSQFGAGDTTFNVSKKLLIEPSLPRFLRAGDEVELRAVARQRVAQKDQLVVRCTTGGNLELIGDPRQEISADKDAPAIVRFKARAGAVGSGTVKFEIVSAADSALTDAVEITLPVAEPVILKKETVVGSTKGGPFSTGQIMPATWQQGRGVFDLSISTSPYLAKLMGLPYLLEYPHGCFEQKSSRLLGYTYLGNLLEYLPDAKLRAENYGKIVEDTCREFEASLLPDGMLPYWPKGTEPDDYVTIQIAWCVSQAEAAGFTVPEQLASDLPETMENMVLRKARANMPPTLRAFAFFVLSTYDIETTDELRAAAEDIFLNRDKLTPEGKAMLAIAMCNLEIAEDKQLQLVRELPTKFADIAFNPETFASATRTEALCSWARLAILPDDGADQIRERLTKLMESSSSLSTQENLWLLVAFDAFLDETPPVALRSAGLKPKPDAVSENDSAVAWAKRDLAKLADFAVAGLPTLKSPGSYVLSAAYRTEETQTPLVSQGMKIERIVKNLTEARRDGSSEAPFQLGDELLISYRFFTDKPQSYVAVEDLLPAGLEVINPNLALFGKFYSVPAEPGVTQADLSHSEIRDQQTNLYFDRLETGARSYSVLARATAAGRFIWPATQMTPMYDSRFFGRSPSSTCVVTSP